MKTQKILFATLAVTSLLITEPVWAYMAASCGGMNYFYCANYMGSASGWWSDISQKHPMNDGTTSTKEGSSGAPLNNTYTCQYK